MSAPEADAEYVFNALGHRVAVILDNEPTYFVYDLRGQVLEERDVNNEVVARFTYGPGMDEPLTMERGGSTYFYHGDAQNSITELTDSSGQLIERYTYDIYGEVTIFNIAGDVLELSAVGNPYLYTGRRLDPESGNYYFRARTYSPHLGRFLQMDPIGYYDGMNRYASYFVINRVDPTGLFALSIPQLDAGISFEFYSTPFFGPFGLYIKFQLKYTIGTCCQGDDIRTYETVEGQLSGGVHVGTPGFKVGVSINATANKGVCPAEGWDCKFFIEFGVGLTALSVFSTSISCSVNYNNASWSWGGCSGGLGGTNAGGSFGASPQGPSAGGTGGISLPHPTTPGPNATPPTVSFNAFFGVGGNCAKTKILN